MTEAAPAGPGAPESGVVELRVDVAAVFDRSGAPAGGGCPGAPTDRAPGQAAVASDPDARLLSLSRARLQQARFRTFCYMD